MMPGTILDGLSLVDTTGRLILASIVASLALAVGTNLLVRNRYRALERDLDDGASSGDFRNPVLRAVLDDARQAAMRTAQPNMQAIVEERFAKGLSAPLLGERFVRAATGLVI